jgi:small subunit ribosomal protein S20
MPVTKTARRALRGSKNKESVNKIIKSALEVAVRLAKKSNTKATVTKAESLADRASKKGIIHKNKAARIKSQLSKLGSKPIASQKKPASKASKTSKKRK